MSAPVASGLIHRHLQRRCVLRVGRGDRGEPAVRRVLRLHGVRFDAQFGQEPRDDPPPRAVQIGVDHLWPRAIPQQRRFEHQGLEAGHVKVVHFRS